MIIKIPGNAELSLPDHGIGLLMALDEALDHDSYEIVYSGKLTKNTIVSLGEREGYSTYILFELNRDFTKSIELTTEIRKQVSYGCSPEILEATSHYQLVTIDCHPICFKGSECFVPDL